MSTSFLPKARRTLYQEIRITKRVTDAYSVWFIDSEQAIRLLKTIVGHNSVLAKHIQKVNLHKFFDNSDYLTFMRQGLQLMHKLKSLTGCIPTSVLSEYCTFQLEVFGYTPMWCDHRKTPEITQFIASQKSLKSLYVWGDPYPNKPFPEAFLRYLKAIVISSRKSFLTGLQSLSWPLVTVYGKNISTPFHYTFTLRLPNNSDYVCRRLSSTSRPPPLPSSSTIASGPASL